LGGVNISQKEEPAMSPHTADLRYSSYCFRISLLLAAFALFLHPMNPSDFVYLAWQSPLETILGYGWQAAVLFWIAIAMFIIAIIGPLLMRRPPALKY
jgi:hypothetical protein